MRFVLSFIAVLIVGSAWAQQPQQSPSAEQILASQIGELSVANALLRADNGRLAKENEELKKHVSEMAKKSGQKDSPAPPAKK